MNTINKIRSHALVTNTQGLSTVEYVIILCLLAVVAIAVWNDFGEAVRGKLQTSTTAINGLP